MQAIEHVIRATRAESVGDLQHQIAGAKQALAELEAEKLEQLADEVHRAQSQIGYGRAMEAPARPRRPIRDAPQA